MIFYRHKPIENDCMITTARIVSNWCLKHLWNQFEIKIVNNKRGSKISFYSIVVLINSERKRRSNVQKISSIFWFALKLHKGDIWFSLNHMTICILLTYPAQQLFSVSWIEVFLKNDEIYAPSFRLGLQTQAGLIWIPAYGIWTII